MAYSDITPKHYPLYNNVLGDDWRIPIPVVQSDRSTVWDFTGWQAHAQVRNKIDGSVIIDFDTYDATIEFSGGTMYLIADKDTTRQLSSKKNAVWDCDFLEPVRGLIRTLILESEFEIVGDVTK